MYYERGNTGPLGWRGSATTLSAAGGRTPTVYAPDAAVRFDTDQAYVADYRFVVGSASNQANQVTFRIG